MPRPELPFLVPFSDDSDTRRADLSLGLRGAVRHYGELVVPGIGGAWRVRHFSWAVAGLWLKENSANRMRVPAATIAQGIEALGNKLAWTQTPEDERRDLRVRGKVAFRRQPDEWSFSKLRLRSHYVQATHRQQVTRALPVEGGIGLGEGSRRFNSLVLSAAGRELALAFLDQEVSGRGSPKLSTRLDQWLSGEDVMLGNASLLAALGPNRASARERALVGGCLGTEVAGSPTNDRQRRMRLIRYFRERRVQGSWQDMPDLLAWLRAHGGGGHADDIEAAVAFEDVRDAGVDVLSAVASALQDVGNRLGLADCARRTTVKKCLAIFRRKAAAYLREAARGATRREDALRRVRGGIQTRLIGLVIENEGRNTAQIDLA